MSNTTTAPMVKVTNQVQTTKNYEAFSILKGNRVPNELHIKRLKASFEKHYLMSPILVNEKMQIIDGQHRFLAAKELKYPVNFLVVKGYGLKEVQILNTNSSNWKRMDYLKAYCDLRVDAYIKMREFMKDFPDFGIQVIEQLLTNTVDTSSNKRDGSTRNRLKVFEEGKLTIPNLTLSYENAQKIMMFKPYYDGYNRTIFVAAMIGLLKHPNYNHTEMLSKLALQPSTLTHCANITQYKTLLENIYNWHRRDKVSLRY